MVVPPWVGGLGCALHHQVAADLVEVVAQSFRETSGGGVEQQPRRLDGVAGDRDHPGFLEPGHAVADVVHAGGAAGALVDLDAGGHAVGADLGAVRERVGDVGDQRRRLGVDLAALQAEPAVDAVRPVAEPAHPAHEGDQQRGKQRRAHLHVVTGVAPAAGLLCDAAGVQVGSLQAVGDDRGRRDRQRGLGHPAAEEPGHPGRGPDRSHHDRQPHHLVAETGRVVLEVDLGRGHQGARGGQRGQAALEPAGLDVAHHPVDAQYCRLRRSKALDGCHMQSFHCVSWCVSWHCGASRLGRGWLAAAKPPRRQAAN
jgi:hypothetical protein